MFAELKKNLKTQLQATILSKDFISCIQKNKAVQRSNKEGKLKKTICLNHQNCHNVSFGNTGAEVQINQFLNKVHQKMSCPDDDSRSQIMQQFSFNWEEELNKNEQLGKLESGQGRNREIHQKKQQIRVSDELIILSEIDKLQEFLKLLGYINGNIAEEIQKIIIENNELKEENGLLKYKQSKTMIKMQLYENQIKVMEKKNSKLLNDIQYLNKQILQLQKNNQNLKNMEIQCNGKHPKISVYLNEFDLKASEKQICQDCNKLNSQLTEIYLSPLPSKIPFQKETAAEPQIKTAQNDLKLKANKSIWKQASTNGSVSTKHSSSTKKLSSGDQNGFNIMISQIKAYSNKFLGSR